MNHVLLLAQLRQYRQRAKDLPDEHPYSYSSVTTKLEECSELITLMTPANADVEANALFGMIDDTFALYHDELPIGMQVILGNLRHMLHNDVRCKHASFS